MRMLLVILGVLMLAAMPLAGVGAGGQQPAAGVSQPVFRVVDVYVDSGEAPLSAYQVEVVGAGAQLVGVEGGEHPAFAEPPFYDPAALHGEGGERIVIAAFSTGDELPSGRVLVARLHVRAAAEVEFLAKVEAAGTRGGGRVEAGVEVVSR